MFMIQIEGLRLDVAAAEEEIARWKVAQLSEVRQELEAKQAVIEWENKLKFKEETAVSECCHGNQRRS
ncbi:unnamed protein product [Ilex paraguariensis]|uniref:Uncharacterized protein n=1 Tax=Ilex paraguariensis TaxID=185542 RepID=A0ABC8RIH8_9AQUA